MKFRLMTSLVAVGLLGVMAAAFQNETRTAPNGSRILLTGTIRSAAGGVLEGVTVSAQQEGQNITTSVFTRSEEHTSELQSQR